MVWSDEDGNLSRGDGEYGKVGQQARVYRGIVSGGFDNTAGTGTSFGFPNQIQVARCGPGNGTQFTIGLTGWDPSNPPTAGSASLSWNGQSFTVNLGDDSATVQAALNALANVDSCNVVGGPLSIDADGMARSLAVRIWATVGNRSGADMVVNSSSITPTGAVSVKSGFGYAGKVDTVDVDDPTVVKVSPGATCYYAQTSTRGFVALWVTQGCE